jgi:hypothetical protein
MISFTHDLSVPSAKAAFDVILTTSPAKIITFSKSGKASMVGKYLARYVGDVLSVANLGKMPEDNGGGLGWV